MSHQSVALLVPLALGVAGILVSIFMAGWNFGRAAQIREDHPELFQ